MLSFYKIFTAIFVCAPCICGVLVQPPVQYHAGMSGAPFGGPSFGGMSGNSFAPGFPGQGMTGQGFPGQGMTGQGFPGQGMTGQGFPGQGMTGQGFPGQGMTGAPIGAGGALSESSHSSGDAFEGANGISDNANYQVGHHQAMYQQAHVQQQLANRANAATIVAQAKNLEQSVAGMNSRALWYLPPDELADKKNKLMALAQQLEITESMQQSMSNGAGSGYAAGVGYAGIGHAGSGYATGIGMPYMARGMTGSGFAAQSDVVSDLAAGLSKKMRVQIRRIEAVERGDNIFLIDPTDGPKLKKFVEEYENVDLRRRSVRAMGRRRAAKRVDRTHEDAREEMMAFWTENASALEKAAERNPGIKSQIIKLLSAIEAATIEYMDDNLFTLSTLKKSILSGTASSKMRGQSALRKQLSANPLGSFVKELAVLQMMHDFLADEPFRKWRLAHQAEKKAKMQEAFDFLESSDTRFIQNSEKYLMPNYSPVDLEDGKMFLSHLGNILKLSDVDLETIDDVVDRMIRDNWNIPHDTITDASHMVRASRLKFALSVSPKHTVRPGQKASVRSRLSRGLSKAFSAGGSVQQSDSVNIKVIEAAIVDGLGCSHLDEDGIPLQEVYAWYASSLSEDKSNDLLNKAKAVWDKWVLALEKIGGDFNTINRNVFRREDLATLAKGKALGWECPDQDTLMQMLEKLYKQEISGVTGQRLSDAQKRDVIKQRYGGVWGLALAQN